MPLIWEFLVLTELGSMHIFLPMSLITQNAAQRIQERAEERSHERYACMDWYRYAKAV